MNRKLIICAAVGVLFAITGCKIHYSMSGASIPAYAKSFSVQYFQVQAPLASPTFGQTLTDGLRDYIASQSHLNLVSNGDLDFQGIVTGFSIAPLAVSSSAQNQSSLTRLTVTVEITYTDKQDPKKCFTASFSRYGDYPSSSTLTSVQGDLLTQIDKQLEQDIFDKAFNNW